MPQCRMCKATIALHAVQLDALKGANPGTCSWSGSSVMLAPFEMSNPYHSYHSQQHCCWQLTSLVGNSRVPLIGPLTCPARPSSCSSAAFVVSSGYSADVITSHADPAAACPASVCKRSSLGVWERCGAVAVHQCLQQHTMLLAARVSQRRFVAAGNGSILPGNCLAIARQSDCLCQVLLEHARAGHKNRGDRVF
jgi:hypothetical protein